MHIKETVWEGLKAVELTTPALRMIGVYEYGPRIAWFGKPDGESLLLWEPEKYTREVEGRETWNLRGGHRCWLAGIGADECEVTYNADNQPADCEITESGFVLTGARDPENGTRRGISVSVVDDGTLKVDSFVENQSDMLLGAALWALTCTLPNDSTRYVIPLGDGASFDTATIVLFKEWCGHGQKSFKDDQFNIEDDALVITPKGKENKRMVQSHAGAIVMSDPERNLTFGKRRAWCELERYPLTTNIAAYVGPDNFMVEMETMGSETSIKPGRTHHHVETWVLKDGALPELTGAAARELFAD